MENFVFYNPTKILFGRKMTEKLDAVIPQKARVLVLFGGGSAMKNGSYDAAKKMLGKRKSADFGGIEANPEYETCLKAVETIKKNKLDYILAIGGGRVIDAAKFIAAAALFKGSPWNILAKDAEVKQALPISSILTLSATGSESNLHAVISRRKFTMKLAFSSVKVFPQAAVLDPDFQATLPRRQTVNGIVDSFIHVFEQYVTYPADAPLQDAFAEAIMSTLAAQGPRLLKHPDDRAARANVMLCSTMALNGLIGCGVPQDWATHAIGHELTAFYGLDHAVTLAIVAPKLLKYKSAEKGEKIAQLGRNVFRIQERNKRAAVKKSIDAITHFFESLGVKTDFASYGIDAEQAAENVANNLEKIGHLPQGERGNIKKEDVKKILVLK